MTYTRILRGACVALALTASVSVSATYAAAQAKAPSFDELSKRAAAALASSTSLAFNLAAKPVTPGFSLAAVTGGDGTIIFPDRMVFQGTLQNSPALASPFVVVGCGKDQYIDMGDGQFMKMDGAPNIGRILFSSDTSFVLSMLKRLENVSTPKAAKVGDVDMWAVSGVVPTTLLATLPSRRSPAAGAVKVELWMGQKDGRLHQLVLSGPLLDTDTQQAVRTLKLSRYNEKFTLAVPRGKMPCGEAAAPAPK